MDLNFRNRTGGHIKFSRINITGPLLVKSQNLIWLSLVDIFQTFYFNDSINLEDEFETVRTNFVFA